MTLYHFVGFLEQFKPRKHRLLPYSIFLTKNQKSLNALNYSRKTHFNPLRIENSSMLDNRQGIFLFILA